MQREVRFHYQWILLHDFLPTIVSKECVLEQVLPVDAQGNRVVDGPESALLSPEE